MPQPKRTRTDSRVVGKAPGLSERAQKGKWTGLIIVLVVIAFILGIFGVFYYQQYVAPFRRTVVKVDTVSIRMDYFLKMTKMSGADPIEMLSALSNQQLVKLGAPRYGIEANSADINQELRNSASGDSGNITESEFREWYRQELNQSGLTDSEYRDIVKVTILASRLQAFLAERVPTQAEQVYLHGILVSTQAEAEKARERWKAGEDFASLAREVSLDENSKENGGDVGWIAYGVSDLSYIAFDLTVGEVSEPIPYAPDPSSEITIYYLLLVSEKATRELDEDQYQILQSKALEAWLAEEAQFHEIKYQGLHNGFDSETLAWINWQLQKE